MESCLNDVDDTLLAKRLECAIEGDSVDDVRAAIEQGAPANFLYKVSCAQNNCICSITLKFQDKLSKLLDLHVNIYMYV